MPWLACLCQGCSCTHNHPLDKTCLKRRNRQIQDNLHLVQPIALHYAQQTGLVNDDLLQVGRLGLIKACNRYDAQRGGKLSKLRQVAHSGSHPSFPLRQRWFDSTPKGR